MSTHSSITVKTSNGKFQTVYCHFDGYPEGVGKTLALHYNSQEKAEALIAGGDISVLGEHCDQPEGHSFCHPVEGYTIYYGRDRGEQNTLARNYYLFTEVLKKEQQEYNYLFDGKEWLCVECPLTEYCCEEEFFITESSE